MNIIEKYKNYCEQREIKFQLDDKVNSYNDTTLFCPAGMQQFKSLFKNKEHTDTIANVQSCIRMNDFKEIGDATHLLYFNMIGLFSFRKMTIQDAVDFWMDFLINELKLKIGYVTIHPDKTTISDSWYSLYSKYDVEVRTSEDCKWTDGEIGGYCTEFFINDVEIGNIVNPLDNCIDVGFGLERLEMFVNNKTINKDETLKETIEKIIYSGYKPSNLKQGYVLRKLLRELYKTGSNMEHQYFIDEIERQKNILIRYEKLKNKHTDKSKEWWFDTHGINLDEITQQIMEKIKESVKVLISTSEHKKIVEEFARSKFKEELKDTHTDLNSWKSFDGFEILSESSIRVKYSYGGGDMEFNDSFIVNI